MTRFVVWFWFVTMTGAAIFTLAYAVRLSLRGQFGGWNSAVSWYALTTVNALNAWTARPWRQS